MEEVTDFAFRTKYCLDMVEFPVLTRSGDKVRFIEHYTALAMMRTASVLVATTDIRVLVAHDGLHLNDRKLVSSRLVSIQGLSPEGCAVEKLHRPEANKVYCYQPVSVMW